MNERELRLTPTELLEYLLERPGALHPRALLDKVWGLGYFGETRTVDVHAPPPGEAGKEAPSSAL
jgi:DNA-binding response OmpR family regulator